MAGSEDVPRNMVGRFRTCSSPLIALVTAPSSIGYDARCPSPVRRTVGAKRLLDGYFSAQLHQSVISYKSMLPDSSAAFDSDSHSLSSFARYSRTVITTVACDQVSGETEIGSPL